MKYINLVVFTERYWDRGLIFSQNILPLAKLAESEKNTRVRLLSFTSLPLLFIERKQIRKAKDELNSIGIDVVDYPVLFYPTMKMYLRWVLLPFYYLNVYFYIKRLARHDSKSLDKSIYSIRSYQAALGFLKFYNKKENIVFDTRTDWIEENINLGVFKENTKTVAFWRRTEKKMLEGFGKTLFISDLFRSNVLQRHGLNNDDFSKYVIVYNPIDYELFDVKPTGEPNFLYTGSLGHWNNLFVYMKFFQKLSPFFPDSRFIVCTGTPSRKVEPIYNDKCFDDIRDKVELYYSVPMNELPSIYARCKYGFQMMTKRDSRVGVKFIEYIAAGVTPIVNPNVEGAAMLAQKYGIGLIVDTEDKINFEDLSYKIKASSIDKESDSFKEFKEYTDLNRIATVLKSIYNN